MAGARSGKIFYGLACVSRLTTVTLSEEDVFVFIIQMCPAHQTFYDNASIYNYS